MKGIRVDISGEDTNNSESVQTNMPGSSIIIDSVSHVYETRSGPLHAVENVSLQVREGEFLALVGPSGSGKSTLLHMIAGLLTQTEGTITARGAEIDGPGSDRGMVFQSDTVFPWMTVEKNVMYGLGSLSSMSREHRKKAEDKVAHYLSKVDLLDHRKRYPKELSGGMRKRVELARAYVTDPDILLLDEPFGSLDALTREAMQLDLVKMAQGEKSQTIVLVTHDIEEAIFLADRVVVMTPRPARVDSEFEVPFSRPRDPGVIASQEFQRLRYEIRSRLEVDVV
ncbi:ABC transporter ATP-binding protein [Microbacterium soli]|uniref:ABC transporter ATP-binding protein n=1 Tax=Microbacterium soli TaxID=446075 RepID=A0ABP7N4E7_9MICO